MVCTSIPQLCASTVQHMCAWTHFWGMHRVGACEGFGEHRQKVEPASVIINAELFTAD